MTKDSSQELLIAVIFMPLSVAVLIIILVCGAVQVYRYANNGGPREGMEDERLPRLTGDSRRNSPLLASEFVETSRTTSNVRTVQMMDDISIVGDAAFAGAIDPIPVAPSHRGPNQGLNFMSPQQNGRGESNTLFAVEFYNQTQSQFIEQGDTSRVSFYERPTSEVFKLTCCFGCCLWKRRAGHLGDSNEPKLVNFDKVLPNSFVDHTIPRQFLCEKPSISLTDLVRIQRANYRALLESTLMRSPTITHECVQNNSSAHTIVDVSDGTGYGDKHNLITGPMAEAAHSVNSSNVRDSVINIPDNNKNVDSQLDESAVNDKNLLNNWELSVLDGTTCPFNSGVEYSVVIHDQKTPVSAILSPKQNSSNVMNNGPYMSFNSISFDEIIDNEPRQNFHNSSSSGVSVDTSETSLSSRGSFITTFTSDSANHLQFFVQQSKLQSCQMNIDLKAAIFTSMRPTDLDEAGEALTNNVEDLQAGLSNEKLNGNLAITNEEMPSRAQHAQELPDLLLLQVTVQHGEEPEDNSLTDQESRATTMVESVNQDCEHGFAEEEEDTQTETKPVDQSCHYETMYGKTFESYYV